MDRLNLNVKLNNLHCYDEGDGSGNAEPFIWVVYLKVDGTTCKVTSALRLEGSATVVGTPGNHRNLKGDVDAGDNVGIQAAIGQYRTILEPIPIAGVNASVGGVFGAVVVLLEEDNTSDSDIAAGHEALDDAVKAELDALLTQLSISSVAPTAQDLAAIQERVVSKVQSVIEDRVDVWSWIAGFGDMDDFIGSKVQYFSHSDLASASGGSVPISARWTNEGDWELTGWVAVTVARERQDNWRWCGNCECLHYAGHDTQGRCPAGGAHVHERSGNYELTQNSAQAPGQENWRWCRKCEALWYAGHGTKGVCAAGGTHEQSGSGNYRLMQAPAGSNSQHRWRWCRKCESLWYSGHTTDGRCAAGGVHDATGSGDYHLNRRED